jgi:hypothetical protein
VWKHWWCLYFFYRLNLRVQAVDLRPISRSMITRLRDIIVVAHPCEASEIILGTCPGKTVRASARSWWCLVNKIHMPKHTLWYFVGQFHAVGSSFDHKMVPLFISLWMAAALRSIVLDCTRHCSINNAVHAFQVSWSMSSSSHHSSPAPRMWIGHQLCRIHDFWGVYVFDQSQVSFYSCGALCFFICYKWF